MKSTASRGVATGCTGVDMSTPLFPEIVPEIDANPVSFFREQGFGVGHSSVLEPTGGSTQAPL